MFRHVAVTLIIVATSVLQQKVHAQLEYNFADTISCEELKCNSAVKCSNANISNCCLNSCAGTFTAFFGIDGSKQPQDFGANANLGVNTSFNYSNSLLPNQGLGFQIGTRVVFAGNAVQVFELLGESHDRFQLFTTAGIFQRLPNGVSWAAAYDFLNQESFDNFSLGQWRVRLSFELTPTIEIGTTVNLAGKDDQGRFNAQQVRLESIEQLNVYLRKRWKSGAQTTLWAGVSDGHSEENVVTGTLPRKSDQFLVGADIFAPLNNWLAIYGETNLMMPADTGAVDAFLGIQFAPQGIQWSRNRANRYRALLPVASSPSFTTDLLRL